MYYRTIGAMAVLISVALIAGPAHALNQPPKGKNFKTNIMIAYQPCTTPDTLTNSGAPACSTPVRVDPACGFGQQRGQGKLQLKSLTVGKTGFRIKMNKLGPGCEGNQLNFAITFRRSGRHCTDALGGLGDCTVVDTTQLVASCNVLNTRCKASGQVQLLGGGEFGQIEILDTIITNESHGGVRGFRTGIINNKQPR